MNLEETVKVLNGLTEQLSNLIGSQERKLDRLVGEREELCEDSEPEKERSGIMEGIERQLGLISKKVEKLEMLNRELENTLFTITYETTIGNIQKTGGSYIYIGDKVQG